MGFLSRTWNVPLGVSTPFTCVPPLRCCEARIRAGRLLGSSRRLKHHTRFQKTMGCWSTTLGDETAWSPSFTSRLSSSFQRTTGLRYGTVTGAGAEVDARSAADLGLRDADVSPAVSSKDLCGIHEMTKGNSRER